MVVTKFPQIAAPGIRSWFVGIVSFVIFLFFQAKGIFGGDSGDLVTAAVTFGVAHPPGYPLYTFLGWLASKIPLFTMAWRVGLVSSIPHAVVVGLVYRVVFKLTKNSWIALYSGLVLVGNYVFFLYSVTAEVFALFDLFIIAFVGVALAWQTSKNTRWLYIGAGIFGLSLTHHQVILFLVPAFAYWIWTYRQLLPKETKRLAGISLVWFLAGSAPFAYIFFAARGTSIVNWDRAVDLSGFIHLVTRADYGTFISGGYFGSLLPQRFIQIQTYAQFVFLDFSWIGLACIGFGLWFLWKHYRQLGIFFALALFFLGPVFFFYASFPLANRFTIGTYERFLLPSYVLYAVLVGCGIYEFGCGVKMLLQRYRKSSLVGVVLIGGYMMLALYPLSHAAITAWRFYGLSRDKTADNLGFDVLENLPRDSILFLGRDTTLFTTQYVRYALGVRPDIIALHASRFSSADYQVTVHRLFPSLEFSGATDGVITKLVAAQYGKRRIFSYTPLSVGPGWYWVPYGLTFELVDAKGLPDVTSLIADNEKIWKTLHDPTVGILSRYNHLMLADVRDVYAGAHIALGTTLLRAGEFQEAQKQFEAAIALGGDVEISSAYTYKGLTALLLNACDSALASFEKAKEVGPTSDKFITFYQGITYRDCVKDEKRAQELLGQFEKLKQQEEIPLAK